MRKKLFSVFVLCLVTFAMVVSGCGNKGLKDNPATDAIVVSNGGMTVVKGDYLYYVNGYIDETTLGNDDNKFGKVSHSGIYRTKLVDGNIVKDSEGFVTATDLVVPKIVGFSNGGFYIIDDYIYYATPYMKLNNSGTLQNDRVEFHKIKIDGTKDQLLYVTNTNEQKLDWTMYKVDGVAYLLTYCESKIISVNCDTKKVVAEVESSTSYAFYYETSYNTNKARSKELMKFVYYTRDVSATDNISSNLKGNVVCKFNVATGNSVVVNLVDDYGFTIKKVDADNIYFLMKNNKISGNDLLYKKHMSLSWVNAPAINLTDYLPYDSYYFCEFGDNLMITTDSNGTWLVEGRVPKKISSESYAVLMVHDNYAYYTDEGKLYRFNIRGEIVSGEIETQLVGNDNKNYELINEKYIDFDNNNIYVYSEYEGSAGGLNFYLNYINSNNLKERFVGHFEQDHIPLVPEQLERYGEDPDVKYIPHID